MTTETKTHPKLLTGFPAWWQTLLMSTQKEFFIMLRYPVEFVASFAQVFLIVTVLTLAGLPVFVAGLLAGCSSSGGASTATTKTNLDGIATLNFSAASAGKVTLNGAADGANLLEVPAQGVSVVSDVDDTITH